MVSIKKGVNSGCFPQNINLEELFQQVKNHGFDGVEFNLSDDVNGHVNLNSNKEELREIASMAHNEGLELPSVSTTLLWKYSLTHESEKVRKQGLTVAKKMIEAAKIFGSRAVLIVPGMVTQNVPYEIAYERALNALNELSKTAEENKIQIGIENVWNKFLLSPLEMKDFIDTINSPWVGCYFDVGNVLQFGYPEQWIKILKDQIVAIHVKDFRTDVGNMGGFVPLLAGDVDWTAVTEALAEIDYSGYVTPEFQPYPQNPEQLIKETSTKISALFLSRVEG
jgi:L-ribulose-5-phosphate 3-epimerase